MFGILAPFFLLSCMTLVGMEQGDAKLEVVTYTLKHKDEVGKFIDSLYKGKEAFVGKTIKKKLNTDDSLDCCFLSFKNRTKLLKENGKIVALASYGMFKYKISFLNSANIESFILKSGMKQENIEEYAQTLFEGIKKECEDHGIQCISASNSDIAKSSSFKIVQNGNKNKIEMRDFLQKKLQFEEIPSYLKYSWKASPKND